MARKKVVTTETLEEAGDTNEELTVNPAEQDEETPESDAISELKAVSADDGVTFVVNKLSGTKPGDKVGYCAKYSAGDLSLEAIRDTFGGGKYKIRASGAGGRIVGTRTVDIVDVPKSAVPVVQAPAAGPDMQGLAALLAAVRPEKQGSETAPILALMAQMMDSNTKMLAGMMQAMMTRKDDGLKLTDILAIVQAGKGNESGVDTLLKGITLGKDLGGGGGETGMLDVALKGLEALSPMIAMQASQRAATPAPAALPPPAARPAATPAPTPKATPAAPATETKENPMLMQKIAWLKQQTGALVYQASRGKDPELYAEVMLDNLPEFVTEDEIFERMQDPAGIAQLAQLDPRVSQFPEWFEAFRQAVIDLLSGEDDEGEEDDEGDQGPPGGPIEGETGEPGDLV